MGILTVWRARSPVEQHGTFVVISSSSVYRDALGRTLDEAMQNGFPDPTRADSGALIAARAAGKSGLEYCSPLGSQRR